MQVGYQNNCDLPPELCAKPLALVGVSGLDTLNNAVHKSIWEAFNSIKRTDKSCVTYKLIENDHEFPVIKPKRNSYDWYVPKGIIKRNWMKKHLYEIPAVIAIFYDLDWSETSWSEKIIECASRVQSMRAALDGRSTRILLVLIQNVLPLPSGEDVQATERAVSICASCELQSNSLFVLPQGDHLQGYTLRLENAFFESAQNYYHNEIRNIKSHKEHLNKSIHQYLFVRHQFKLGFLYELKQDIHTAHKHYTHAYNSLLEVRIVDTVALEIRTIVGFINYKLCRLLFALNLPRDAIAHFRSHIDKFKSRLGFYELSFEHLAWLSKQFSMFGDIFDAAVKLGVAPVQTQHPGIYYQQAADYAIMRKNFTQDVCENVTEYPKSDPFDWTMHLDFYGQRPWRNCKSGMETLDPELELSGIQALQYLEKQVNHSNIIISLYGLAIQQYKIYKCPRTRRYLVIQMADEYYRSGDFGKCLTLLTHMLFDLRPEKWWSLLSDILVKAIKCAYLTANIPDYVSLAFELLGKNTTLSLDEKKFIWENLDRLLKIQIPYGDNNVQPDVMQHTIIQWQSMFSRIPINTSLDMGNITTCINARAVFSKTSFEVNDNVAVNIFLRNESPFVLKFSGLSVTITSPAQNFDLPVHNGNFEIHPGTTQTFVGKFLPKQDQIYKTLQVTSVNLTIGDPKLCSLEFKFSNCHVENGICFELLHFRFKNEEHSQTVNNDSLSKTLIYPRHSRLNIRLEHASPALQDEWYEVTIHLNSEEPCALKDFKIEVSLTEDNGQDGSVEFAKTPSGALQKVPFILDEYPVLEDVDLTLKFFMKINTLVQQNVEVKAQYNLINEPIMSSVKTVNTVVDVETPFKIVTKFVSSQMSSEINQFYCGEMFYVLPMIECLSPWELVIESTDLEYSYQIEPYESNRTKRIINTLIKKGETNLEIFPLLCNQVSEHVISIGQYSVKWRRQDGYLTVTQASLSGFPVQFIPLYLSATLPAYGIVRQPLLIVYNLQNHSDHLIQLQILMEASDAFMFAGYKQFTVSILPKSSKQVNYNLYPLITGKVVLPKITMKIPEGSDDLLLKQDEVDDLMGRSLPKDVYIMPQVKGVPRNVPSGLEHRNVTPKVLRLTKVDQL